MSDEQQPQSMSKTEAAGRLNVSVRTLERLLVAGELEGVRDGPKGGLRPTRASVEHRLEQLDASTSAPDVQAESAAAGSLASAPDINGDGTTTVSRAELAPVLASTSPPRHNRLARGTGRVGARLLCRCRREAMRALRGLAKHPARAARCLIAAALIAGLVALGVTRERSAGAASHGDVTLLVITPGDDGRARQRTRLRCRAGGGAPVKVYVRRGKRARCQPPGDGRTVP